MALTCARRRTSRTRGTRACSPRCRARPRRSATVDTASRMSALRAPASSPARRAWARAHSPSPPPLPRPVCTAHHLSPSLSASPLPCAARHTSPHQANRRGLWGQCETPSPPSPPSRPSTPSPPPPPPPASAKAAPRPAARAGDADSRRADATGLPNPGDSKNCKDFASYGEAKAWFDKYYPMYGDVAKLDGNGDGRPCESLLPKSGGR